MRISVIIQPATVPNCWRMRTIGHRADPAPVGSDHRRRRLHGPYSTGSCAVGPGIRTAAQLNPSGKPGRGCRQKYGYPRRPGDILCFLDSDDRFVPEKIASQLARLRASPCLISHTRELWLRRGLSLSPKKKHQPPHGDIFGASLAMCVVGMSTVMARREVFDRYGLFDETLPCCEDYEYWLRVGSRERFLLVDQPLTVKNGGRADQLSVRYRTGMDRYRIHSLVKLLGGGWLTTEQSLLAVRELERKCAIYARGCVKHGRHEEGQTYLRLPDRFRPPVSPDAK